MKAFVSAFRLQKAGNAEAEYEDSFWPLTTGEVNLPVRIAAADGATDAIYSGLWAHILVKSWGKGRITEANFLEAISRKAKIWQRIIRQRHVPWYVEEKARLGTYAAFIGVDLAYTRGASAGTWAAIACGDCCLFQIRNSRLLAAFPVSRSGDFSNAPLLVSTGAMSEGDLKAVQIKNGTVEEGDDFYLMSDALACWFLAQCESGEVPLEILRDITFRGEPSFPDWIAELRRRGELKNDDCTLVSVTFE